MPRVDIIIPTYNSSGYLREAIESVLAQTYRDYQIMVFDDGSTDNTQADLKPYGDQIRYFRKKNEGVTPTRNFALRHLESGGHFGKVAITL